MADIQNMTFAGGVTVGASVDMMISPVAAYALGIMGYTACFFGYRYLSPFLARTIEDPRPVWDSQSPRADWPHFIHSGDLRHPPGQRGNLRAKHVPDLLPSSATFAP